MADTAAERKKRDLEELEGLERIEDWTQVKRLAVYLRPRRARIAIAVIGSLILSGLLMVPALLARHIVDEYVADGNLHGVMMMCVALFGVMILTFILDVFTSLEIQKLGLESIRDLRMDLFSHLQKMSLSFYDQKAVGWLVTRVVSDVNVLRELFAQGVVGIFQQVFSLVVIVGVLLWANWRLALISFAVVPLVMWVSAFFRNRIRTSYRLTRSRLSKLNTHVQENVSGIRTVHANTREARQFTHFEDLNARHRDAHQQTVFAYSVYFPAIEIISTLGVALIVWQGGRQFLSGTVTVGDILLFVLLLERFFMPIRDLSEKYNLVQSAIAASERLFGLLDTKPTIQEPEQPAANTTFDEAIRFEDVWMAYKGEDWVLRGVSFEVKRGQTVAIVGPTGSGKTTLMSLLCRFYDVNRGRITLDGTDIRQMTQRTLRERIAIVLQDVFLFRGSVEENVRLGDDRISRDRVEEVCRAVEADNFIQRLPKGYESNVMERGATLSAGQKQLLSFARALAFDPEILILDEATANIDTETEKLIQSALDRLCAGRTALVIAHRLSTIQRADKILVLHHGHLVEEGTHRELLARDGLYRRLYELQYRETEEAEAG